MTPLTVGIIQTIIIIIVISYTYFNQYRNQNAESNKIRDDIDFNLKNMDDLKNHFYALINEKIRLIESGQMDTSEWIDEVKSNILINVKDYKYYYTVYQKIPNKDNVYICRVNKDEDTEGISYDSMINQLHYEKLFSNFKPDEKMIDNIYANHSLSTYDFYAMDTKSKNYERKRMIARKFDNGKGYSGVIGVIVTIEDLTFANRDYYINCINKFAVLATILITLFLTILLSKISESLSFLYFTFIMSFIVYYLNLFETFDSAKVEADQIKEIDSSILSLTFYSAITIFLLSRNINLKDVSKTILRTDYPFLLFTVSGLYILCSMFVISDYKDFQQLKSRRLTKQYLFNYSIIINIILVIHFLVSYYYDLSVK